MSLRSTPALAGLAVIALLAAGPAAGQSSLRILRHSPADSAPPSAVITVTFDRPVAGQLGASLDPRRVLRIDPAIEGDIAWRDPVTIQFRPAKPLTPGLRLTAVVDTTFVTPAGARLSEPYRISLRVVGPAPVAMTPNNESVGPRPAFRVLYSAPVDVESLRGTARVEFDSPCVVRSVPLIPMRQIPVERTDAWYWTGAWPRDTIAEALRRVVEFEPASPLPGGCRGFWHVPSLDPERPASTWRYRVVTWSEPRLTATCQLPCRHDGLRLDFGAPVRAADVKRYVHITPAIGGAPRDSMSVGAVHVWNGRLEPRTSYTVSVDSAMRDVFGRQLVMSSAAIHVADRLPTIYHEAGAITVSRARPVIRVRTVNVDSIRVSAFPIPDSLRGVILANSRFTSAAAITQLRPALSDTIVFTVPVRGTFNRDATTEIPLADVVGRTAYTAISLDVAHPSAPPDSAGLRRSAAPVDHVGFGVQYVQASDLIAQAKVGSLDGAVFVTTRAGAPVSGASVALIDGFGNRLAGGKTDRDGLASFHGVDARPLARPVTARDPFRAMTRLLEISTASDWLTIPVVGAIEGEDQRNLQPWQLDARLEYSPLLRAALSTDRGIYRPGERLYARIVARTGWRGAFTPPAGDSLRWRITGESEDTVWAKTAALSAAGTAADSLTLPPSLTLGDYTLGADVRREGNWTHAGDYYFRVAEYRAPEFELAVHADSTPRVAGDTIDFRIHGEYLFGAPMSAAVIRWSSTLSEIWGPWLPKLEGFTVGVDRWWWANRRYELEQRSPSTGVDSLDASGQRIVRIPTGDASAFSRPATLQLIASATDAGNQSIASGYAVTVHPVSTYIAVGRDDGNRQWQVGERQRLRVKTVRPDGSTRPGVTVSLAVRRMRWIPGDTPDRATGLMGAWHVDTIETRRVVTDTSAVAVDFTPRSMDHFDLLFTARDEQDRVTSTSIHGVVEGAFAPYGSRPANRLRLAVTRDSTRPATVGDTVTVAFDSPFKSAHAWVTIEREGIISQRRITAASGRNTFRVPILSGHVPNLWVGVTLVRRDRAPSGVDSLENEIRAGYLEIPVDAASKRVFVTIDPGVTYAPGDTAVVRFTVRERDSVTGPGVAAEVALWAVDEGILALTGFQAPDLLREFYSPGGLGTALRSSLAAFPVNNLSFMQLRGAGGAGMGGGFQLSEVVVASAIDYARTTAALSVGGVGRSEPLALRQAFRSTAFYLGAIHTGRDGSATIRAKLPDNVTTYRIMAVATTSDDRYGRGETRMLTTRDLVLRPALPRFVRPGDEMSAGGLVNVRSGASDRVSVEAAVTGAIVRGDTIQSGNVGGGRPMPARFDFRVPTDATSAVRVVLRAIGSLGNDAVATTMPLGPVGTPRAHTVTGVVRDSTTMHIDLPADIDPARSTITLGFGGSPIAAIRSHRANLRAYPYYATECVVSAARALIALQHAETVLDDHGPEMDSATVRSDLQRAADAVIRRETGGYVREWDSDSPYQHLLGLWSTAYAGEFLLEARARGVRVSSGTLQRMVEMLGQRAQEPNGIVDTVTGSPHERRTRWQAWLGTRLVVAKFLRHAGQPDTASERELLARAGEMRWEDRVWLADLLVDADRGTEARAMLDDAWRAIRPIGGRLEMPDSLRGFAGFPSHVRPAARLMIVTMRLDPARPLAGALAETLMQQGRAEQDWAWNTQDYATASMALADFAAASRGSTPRRVLMLAGNRELLAGTTNATTSGSTTLTGLVERHKADSSRVSVSIRVAEPSGAPVFFAITVTEVPKSRPVTPDVTGIVVERWYETFADGKPIVEATEGDLVRVRLRVTVPADRQFVAVEDLLPAGLEPVDLTLRTEGIGPFATTAFAQQQERMSDSGNLGQSLFYGGWDGGWWTPWEHKEIHDDRITWSTRQLWAGSYTASYVARATTPGTYVRPPAHAEEMYDRAIQGRSDGGVFVVRRSH